MICRIADLLVEIPETEDMIVRCKEYLTEDEAAPDIVIRKEQYKLERWEQLSEADAIYMESGGLFYSNLVLNNGILLHSSAVEYEGKAYLFSGPSGMGKSTHTRLWRELLGDKVRIFNDDKPALRYIDGKWYAYGTPWCGKDGININTKVPLAGICFLRRGKENAIRRLSKFEAANAVLSQTLRPSGQKSLELVLGKIEELVDCIPVYELANRPELQAAQMAYNAMKDGVRES